MVLEPPLLEEVEEVCFSGVLAEEVVLYVPHLVVVGALDHYPLSDPASDSLAFSEDAVGANAAVSPVKDLQGYLSDTANKSHNIHSI